MEKRVSVLTLGVRDLDRAREFYRDVLGWEAEPGPPEIAFYDLDGLVFALYPQAELLKDIGFDANASLASKQPKFTVAHNLRSKQEVDELFAKLREKDAKIVKEPQEVFWGGYSGYFADPDNNYWEVAYNPFWQIQTDGRISMQPDENAID